MTGLAKSRMLSLKITNNKERALYDGYRKLQIDFTEKGTQSLIMASQNGKLISKSHTKKKTTTTQNVNLLH